MFVLFAVLSVNSLAGDFTKTEEKLVEALKSENRTEKEKLRDKNRKPIETLAFLGFREDMKVVELVPGGGWYTKLLAPVLKENGEFIVALGTSRVEKNLMSGDDFSRVSVTAKESVLERPEGSKFYSLDVAGFNVKKADMVLTFRNYHNFNEKGRQEMNKVAHKALKKGGVYGVVDHTRRHMEGDTAENRRRFDPVLAIKEIQEAGFEFVDYSPLHYRPDDELRYEVGRRSVSGNTDRFTLLFKKK